MSKRAVNGLAVAVFVVLLCLGGRASAAGPASAEAQRYFTRGLTAAEMAKSPDDYDLAIEEFTKARSLAPDWPEVHYNLGLVQDKAGRFRDAAASLKRYLQLAPDAPDAQSVTNLMTQLEFKAENTLTKADIISVLTSLSKWKVINGNPGWDPFRKITSKDEGLINVPTCVGWPPCSPASYQTLKVEGPTVKYRWKLYSCSLNDDPGDCNSIMENEIEVLSKTHVKIRQLIVLGAFGRGAGNRSESELSAPK